MLGCMTHEDWKEVIENRKLIDVWISTNSSHQHIKMTYSGITYTHIYDFKKNPHIQG